MHLKDRVRGGGTVPLGTGAVDFPTVFAGLAKAGYRGDFILQSARQDLPGGPGKDPVATVAEYLAFLAPLVAEAKFNDIHND